MRRAHDPEEGRLSTEIRREQPAAASGPTTDVEAPKGPERKEERF